MPKITPGNRLYFYQLFQREIGFGNQVRIAVFADALDADDIAPADCGCVTAEELLGELGEFLKITTFKKGRVFATLQQTPELDEMLAKAKSAQADLVVLTGDIISFPTLANVEFAAEELRKSGLDWIYTAGNHDWHFEGVPGSDAAQREEWIPKRLMPLYGADVDPLAYSKVVKGIRFVAIDNSIYHVTERQLAFWRSEIAKGDPTVLLMHIPLWMDGFEICTCGNPNWGAAADRIWEIERREKWAERQSAESFALRSDVLEAPNLIAVLTGHLHRWMSASHNGRLMFSAPHGKDGFACDIRIASAF